jgi:hypothetical protein
MVFSVTLLLISQVVQCPVSPIFATIHLLDSVETDLEIKCEMVGPRYFRPAIFILVTLFVGSKFDGT